MSKNDADKAEKAAPQTDEQKAAAAAEKVAKAAAKAAAKVAEKEAKAAAKAARDTERAEKDAAAAAAKASREAAAAAKKAAREAATEEAKAKGLTYVGSMLALRNAKDHYIKGTNGRLRSNDAVALALDAVEPAGTVELAMKVLGITENPYLKLNVGQQSMNFRNKLRGAIRKGTMAVEALIEARDAGGYTAAVTKARADAEAKAAELAAKKEAAAARALAKALAREAQPA